jgi:dihydrofolate reductase
MIVILVDNLIKHKNKSMRKLIAFNHITLDGYFVGTGGEMSWAYAGNDDPEYTAFVAGNASGGGELLFGRVTYDLMAGYWPTPMADQHDPLVAEKMNSLSKIVFSRTMNKAEWNNTKLIKGDLISEIRQMKNGSGPDMTILGSGTIIAQLAPENLIDEYQIILDPVALGKGRSMFEGIPKMLKVRLTKTRTFNNGKIFLCFAANN